MYKPWVLCYILNRNNFDGGFFIKLGGGMKLSPRLGQQLIEYLLLFLIVIIILILFINPFGFFRKSVNRALNLTLDQINREATKF